MIGFTKEEIVKLANQWIDENQQWADSVVIQTAQQAGTNPFEQLEACSLANFKKVLPVAIATILEKQNLRMEEQIKDLIRSELSAK